jgi:integrase
MNLDTWKTLTSTTDDGAALTNEKLIGEFIALGEQDALTLAKYEKHLGEFAEWLAPEGRGLLDAQRRDVLRFLAYLRTDGRVQLDGARPEPRGWRGNLSASTRKGYLAALREFWRHCARMDYTDRDPTSGVPCPKVEHRPGLTLTRDELRRFLDAPGRPRCRVIAYLYAFTAARSSQVRRLRWEDVDFERKEISFHTRSKSKFNVVPLHPELDAALRRWKAQQEHAARRNERLAAALADPETAFVLLTYNGKPLAHSTPAKQLKWRAARVGVKPHRLAAVVGRENTSRVHPHALRRTWATRMLNEFNASLEDIADVLNHSSTDTTRKHYAFTSNERKRKTVASFAV